MWGGREVADVVPKPEAKWVTGVRPNRPVPREVSAFGDSSVLSAAETGQFAAGAGGSWQLVSSAPAVDALLPRCPPSGRVCQGGGGVLASSEDGDLVDCCHTGASADVAQTGYPVFAGVLETDVFSNDYGNPFLFVLFCF